MARPSRMARRTTPVLTGSTTGTEQARERDIVRTGYGKRRARVNARLVGRLIARSSARPVRPR